MTDASFSLRRIAVAVYAPSFLFGLGEGAVLPVIALGVRQLGGSVAMAALVVTLLGIGSLVCNVPASLITHRYGERAALVGAAIWGAAAMALCVLAGQLWLFATGVFMIGMAAAVFGLARQSYLVETVPFAYRARALSALGGVMRIGLFAGPFVAAVLIHFIGIGGAWWAGAAALLVAAAVGWRMADLPAPEIGTDTVDAAAVRAAPTIRSVGAEHARTFLTIGLGVLLVSAVRALRQVVIPLWADQLGLAPAVISLIYGFSGGIDMLVFYPAGKVMDRRGREWVGVPSMVILGFGIVLVPFTQGATSLLIASLVIGFGNGIGSGVLMTLGADYSPVVGRAHFLGLWRLLSDIGATGGPALLSAVTALASLAAGVWSVGLLGFAAAGLLWYWIPRTNERLVVKRR